MAPAARAPSAMRAAPAAVKALHAYLNPANAAKGGASSGPPVSGAARLGMMTGMVFLVGFGLLGTLAPMESAAIAPGAVQVEGSRKSVQHLEGGIVGTLAVREGAVVKAGEVLMRLDDTVSRAMVDQLRGQSDEKMTALRDCLGQIDRSVLQCLAGLDEYQRRYADLDTLNKNLAGLGVSPEPLPDKISVEHLSETISTRLAQVGQKGRG